MEYSLYQIEIVQIEAPLIELHIYYSYTVNSMANNTIQLCSYDVGDYYVTMRIHWHAFVIGMTNLLYIFNGEVINDS